MIKRSSHSQLELYRRKLLRVKRLIYTSALLGLASPLAYAANTEFNGSIDNDWSKAANWSNGLPGSSDRAIIDSIITSEANVSLSAKLSVGLSADGSLTISNATFTTDVKNVELGAKSGTTGTLHITGYSSFINSGIVEVGKASAGTGYIVLDGGNITGNQYRLGAGGSGSFGSLHVKDGTVNLATELRVGSGWQSIGQLTFDQGILTVPNLTLGYSGSSQGTLVINGGVVNADTLALGRNASSIVAIELNGGVLQTAALANVGGTSESINIAGGILRLQQGADRALFDSLIANGSLYWTPGAEVKGYELASADETIVDANGTLYIRNDADGYFSAWSTTNAPLFINVAINGGTVTEAVPYSSTLKGTATDANSDALTYAKISGPAWLNVTASGELSGIPTTVGLNAFTVQVSDGNDGSDTTTLNINVSAAGDFTQLIVDDFEAGSGNWGNWLAGGIHAKLAGSKCIGSQCANIQAFGVESSITLASALDLSSYHEIKIGFSYMPKSFESNESFRLSYSSDGGLDWTTLKTYVNGVDFNNDTRETVELSFTSSAIDFTDNALIRFQANGSGDGDDIYIDNIRISASNSNTSPVFTNNPIYIADANQQVTYEGTLAGLAIDLDGDSLTYSKTKGSGWLKINEDGSFSSVPYFSGTFTFDIEVSDGYGGSATAELIITVIPEPNEAPVFTNESLGNAIERAAYSGQIIAFDADDDPLTYSKVSGPNWLTVAANGMLTGSPTTADIGANVFTVQASDGKTSAEATINITVEESVNTPVFTNDPIIGTNGTEAVVYISSLVSTATDADFDTLTYAKVSGVNWLSVTTNGVLSGTPRNSDVGLNVFTIQVNDGNGGIATATLNITIFLATDNKPPILNINPIIGYNAQEDLPYNATIAGSATDPDGDPLTYTKISGPTWLNIAANGALNGTPETAGSDTFTVQVSDNQGGSTSAALNITIDAPIDFTQLSYDDFENGSGNWGNWLDGGMYARLAGGANGIGAQTAAIEAFGEEANITLATSLNLLAYNNLKIGFYYNPVSFDGSENFSLQYSADGGINWRTIKNFVNQVDFTTNVSQMVEYTFTEAELSFTDNALVRFQINSSGNGDDLYIDNISIAAAYINHLPVFVNDPIIAANASKNWAYSGTLAGLATDTNLDSLTFSKVAGPTWLSIYTDGTYSGTPVSGDVGPNSFTVQADDGAGGITPVILYITVEPSLAPNFSASTFSSENGRENTAYNSSIAGDANDLDGDPISFTKLSGPNWLTIADNGSLSGTPTTANVGVNSFSVQVTDSFGTSDTATLNIYVGSVAGGYPQYSQTPTADEWILAFGLTGTDAETSANPDGDARDNFQEYAYGGDPSSSNDEQLVQDIQIFGNSFTVSHTRLRNAASFGINYQFQIAQIAAKPLWLDVTADDINVQLLSDSYELVSYSGVLPFIIGTDTTTSIGRLIATRSGPFAQQDIARSHAELVLSDHITTKSGNIYEDRFGYAAPQGDVDNNSPWMHVRIQFAGDPDWPADRGTRLYHYKLSQDSTLTTNVITETPKRWSFFNASTKLAQGSWYWTAGYSMVDDAENIEWLTDDGSKPYQFEISGNEEQYIPPSADTVWAMAMQKPEPRLLMAPNDFGRLLDIDDATTDNFIAHADSILTNNVANSDTVAKLVLAYAASGDIVYRDEALARYENVPPSGDGAFAVRNYVGMGVAFLDLMGDELPPEMEADLVTNMLDASMHKNETWIKHMLDKYEHENYESHIVQKTINTLMFSALAIGEREPIAKEMFQYAYELWLYKGPHGGRSDGSWHNGFGYLSVNEDQLMATPWILGELSGFDYTMHPWYRNHSKFMSYIRAPGNPGQYYGDAAWDAYSTTPGGGPGSAVAQLHSYTHPNNRWMRWQARYNDTPLPDNKVKKMAEEWQRWLYLPIRKNYVEPDFVNVTAPIATADAYKDVGYVAAHSNIEDPSTNFMTTMRSSPFSSSHKSHASQNAFTTAYGGEPLFYRTGWRKKGDMSDYADSKAFNLIMPNGVSQKRRDKSAYAFLPRFAHGDRMSYWIGDASNSYPEATGVNRFRRHMVHLKPNILVIYDEIESSEAATTWTYTLNAHNEIKAQSDNIISVHNGFGLATANLFSSSALSTIVSGPTIGHWNTRITTTEQMPAVRFLNVIELTPSTDINQVVAALPATGTNLITVAAGDYTVVAQVDPNQPARLEIRSSDGNVALLYGEGVNTLIVDGKVVLSGRYKSSTLFMEKNTPRGDIVEELVDKLPDSITYSNKY